MKPDEGNKAAVEEYLVRLQNLQRNEGYAFLMQQVDDLTRGAFSRLIAATDPTTMAKEAGRVAALRDVRSWVDSEIQATLEAAEAFKKSAKK